MCEFCEISPVCCYDVGEVGNQHLVQWMRDGQMAVHGETHTLSEETRRALGEKKTRSIQKSNLMSCNLIYLYSAKVCVYPFTGAYHTLYIHMVNADCSFRCDYYVCHKQFGTGIYLTLLELMLACVI